MHRKASPNVRMNPTSNHGASSRVLSERLWPWLPAGYPHVRLIRMENVRVVRKVY